MEFDLKGVSDTFDVDPQVRLGAAFKPFDILKIGLDVDLLENEFDGLEGFKSRLLAGGVELSLLPIKIRGGIFTNTASDETTIVYSLGIGLRIGPLLADINGMISGRRVKVEVDSPLGSGSAVIPERFAFSFTIGLDFSF